MAQFQGQALNGLAVQPLEVLVRTALFQPATALGGFLLQAAADRIDAADQPQPGQARKGRETRHVQSLCGSFPLTRDYYSHAGTAPGPYPAAAALGLETGHTPALARLVCLEGADETSCQKAETQLLETGGLPVSARQIQRTVQRVGAAAQAWQERDAQPGGSAVPQMYVRADATGVPRRKEERVGRAGQQAEGSAKTRSAYLGGVFTQHQTDNEGHPGRDYESTTSVSSFGSIDELGPVLRQDAIRRGLALALQVVLLIDGAEGLAKLGRLCFPGAIQSVDFYHALEHAGQVLVALLGSKEHPDDQKRLSRWARRLLHDQVESLIAQARRACAGPARAQAVEKEWGDFIHNVERMQHGTFRRQGFFMGSGVIEAGCKTVLGARGKQSGMFWGEPGAENVLALRCIHSSRRLAEFWQDRLHTHAARNDSLALAA